MKYLTLPVMLISCLLLGTSSGAPPDAERKVDDLMENWKSVKPEFLRDPANVDVVEALRRRATSVGYRDIRALLLKLDDPEFTSFRLAQFRKSKHLSDSADIIESGNPKLILALSDDLFEEESAEVRKIWEGGEAFRYEAPLSVRAAYVIRGIVRTNPAFNASVNSWAKNLGDGPRHAERTRAEVRAWFTANRRFLEAANYRAVKAP